MKKSLIVFLFVLTCLKADELYVSTSFVFADYIKNISTWDRGVPLSLQLGASMTVNQNGNQTSLYLEAAGSGIVGIGYSYGFLISGKRTDSKVNLLISSEIFLHQINFNWKKSHSSGFMSPMPYSTSTNEGKLKAFYVAPGISFKLFNAKSTGLNAQFIASTRYHYKLGKDETETYNGISILSPPYLVSSMEYSVGIIFSYKFKTNNLKQTNPNRYPQE